MVLDAELAAIAASRTAVLLRLEELGAEVDRGDPLAVNRAGHCRECDVNMDGPLCGHCLAQEMFQVRAPERRKGYRLGVSYSVMSDIGGVC